MLAPTTIACALPFFKVLLRDSDLAQGADQPPHTRPGLGVAADWRGAVVRIRAKRPELRSGVDTADHGNRTSLMLAIERRGFRRVELA